MAFDKFRQMGGQLGELKRMRSQAMEMQRQLAAQTVTIEEKGVRVVISGDQKIKELEINDASDQKVKDVLNKAVKESQKVAAKQVQEMSGGLSALSGMLGK